MGSLSRAQLVKWLKTIDVAGKRVLDCGTSPPNKWAINWIQGKPESYETLDIGDEPPLDFNLDLNRLYNWPDSAGPEAGVYDTIFFLEVCEHLWNPVVAMCRIAGWLRVGGELYFSAPFINPIHDVVDCLRLTGEWWERAGKATGFKIDYIEPRRATDGRALLLEFYRAEGLRMSKIRLQRGDGQMIDHIGYYGRLVKATQDE
jgi:SAM-dependent methyltransferase